MNIWYTVEDISLGYKLSVRDLRLLVKHGDIWSLMFTKGKVKIVLIPDSELWKLENYRRAGEYPHYDVSHQMKRFISHQWNIEPPELDTRIRRKFASYADYMNSYEWLRKRMAVMKRDSYRCVKCGGSESLCVHHLTYARLGHEELSDLQTLCSRCHYLTHFT